MSDLFDIANLITKVGVDAVKIKPEPGLPEKSSNEILTELFSTFDVDGLNDDDDDEEEENKDDNSGSSSADDDDKDEEKKKKKSKSAAEVNRKVEKGDDENGKEKKKKFKKKHKHKHEGKDKDKKHKHKKKSRHNSSESASDAENKGLKKKKKKKKSKRKSFDLELSDIDEPTPKKRKLEKDKSIDKGKSEEKSKTGDKEAIKIKKEKLDPIENKENADNKEKTPDLPPVSKILNDDVEAPEVPKLLEKTKAPTTNKILIKDLKNSEVFNNTVKEIENKKKEKEERMEDGEITDSDDDNNRTPTLSPTPPPEGRSGMRSDRKKYSRSPSSSRHITQKHDLRLVLKEREKKKLGERSRSKSDRKDEKGNNRSHSCNSRDKKSRSNERHGRGRSRDRYDSRRGGRSRRSRDNEDRYRGRSRSRERKERIEIDKKKLLEIARRNAINMIMKGKLPLAQQDKAIAAIQAGGKTIEELTDFCKSLSKSEAMGELSSISSDDESGSEKGFHHPFLLKDRPSSIIMNIRDSKQLPTKTFLEKTTESPTQLRLQFPVSSGQQHRKNEKEWVPVPPKPPKSKNAKPNKLFVSAKEILHNQPLPLIIPSMQEQQAMQNQVQPTVPVQVVQPLQAVAPNQVVPATIDPSAAVIPQPVEQQQSVFPTPPNEPIDISAIVSQRLAAMRKLSENPNDVQALNEMYRAQNGMRTWAESKQVPGQFTGSTGAKVLSQAELNSGFQAWARKDQLITAQPVSGGMGMALLQKMGWKPGEGLGKNKEGTLEPLTLEVKLDKKGLITDQDIPETTRDRRGGGRAQKPIAPTVKSLEGKHPVSLLGEFCSKRKYGAPVYELCFECGPDHKKNFLFKVKVNGIEYKPAVASPNKKLAKAEAAQVCLQNIGLLPS